MTWMSVADDREKYKAYLCSREWAVLRNAVRERCGGKCERCGRNPMDCVHHLTYARKYEERLEDLAGWCNACHEFTHGKTDVDPAEQDVIDRDGFLDIADCCEKEGYAWEAMAIALLLGLGAIDRMGINWLRKAARGELMPKADIEAAELDALIRKRRQEQGIA